MGKKPTTWKFCFLLHNLELKSAFESKFMAIVPSNDFRISKIIAAVPAVGALIRNFTDQNGQSRNPCALIVRENAPDRVGSLDAIISFRNIFSLSCLLYAWPRTIGNLNVFFPLWSDFFDFYPTTIMRDPNFLHTLSPAINGGCLPDKFKGQVSPNLPNPIHLRFEPDNKILSLLINVWKKEFVETNPQDWSRNVLFRSLEMANQAASLPSNSRSTIYDFGSRIALWVSAFEVLVHPGGEKGRANLEKVVNLLKQSAWHDSRLKNVDYQLKINGKMENVNLVQKLYGELNETRNDFLHGNPVAQNRLFCFRNEDGHSLLEIAPVLYRVALNCIFGQIDQPSKNSNQEPNYRELFGRRVFENSLLATLENRK